MELTRRTGWLRIALLPSQSSHCLSYLFLQLFIASFAELYKYASAISGTYCYILISLHHKISSKLLYPLQSWLVVLAILPNEIICGENRRPPILVSFLNLCRFSSSRGIIPHQVSRLSIQYSLTSSPCTDASGRVFLIFFIYIYIFF